MEKSREAKKENDRRGLIRASCYTAERREGSNPRAAYLPGGIN